MTSKISLENRKRLHELADSPPIVAKKAELKNYQDTLSEAPTPADRHLQEVKKLVDHLTKMTETFEGAGSQHRRQFSLQVQHDALQAEIRLALQQKAQEEALKGLDEQRNLLICQAFIDDVIIYLAKAGIRLNPLNVLKVRKSKFG